MPPLYHEAAIYEVVSRVNIGEPIPGEIYVHDYQDGTIPYWVLKEREEIQGRGLIITVIDVQTLHDSRYPAHSYVGMDIVVMPTRFLAGPTYLYSPGYIHRRNQFCDTRQEARKIAERIAGEHQGAFVAKQRDRELAVTPGSSSSECDAP